MVQGTSSRAACEGASRTGFVGDKSGPLIQSSDLKRCSGCSALPCRVHFCAVTESTSQSAASPATTGALDEARYQLWEHTPWAGLREICYGLCPYMYCHRQWTRIVYARPSPQMVSCINTKHRTESGKVCSTFVGMSNPELLDAAMLQALEEHMRLAPTCEIVGVRMHVMLNHRRFEHQLHRNVCLRAGPRRR